ncbi:MAG TPA: glutathione S-transferase family protein [Steroidobacteraceae bacterium]|jgi:glutathione S-transferase|nr:glutathione S-transferase family protein [Steroidobacteraceae bacterium]
MYRLYDYLPSGNGYKVRLVLKQLALQYELIELDVATGATRTADFLAKNPNGRIPLLEVPGKGFLPESHAIIAYLADGTRLIPADPFERARMWQWMCFEQYNLEPNIATLRFWLKLGRTRAELGEKLVEKKKNGYAALDVLEETLGDREYLAAGQYSLADIALYAYTHVAHEGGFDLAPYPAIRAWCERVEKQPSWAPITER